MKEDVPKWHQQFVHCRECGVNTKLIKVAFAADGEILLIGVCPGCKKTLAIRLTWAKVIADCAMLDHTLDGNFQEGNDSIN